MPTQPPNRTLSIFINHHLDRIPSTPPTFHTCALCTRSANLRVNLPTCNHCVCANCLAEFVVFQSPATRFSCLYCLTYWFTIEAGYEIRGNKPRKMFLELRKDVEKSEQEIWRTVVGGGAVVTNELASIPNEDGDGREGFSGMGDFLED